MSDWIPMEDFMPKSAFLVAFLNEHGHRDFRVDYWTDDGWIHANDREEYIAVQEITPFPHELWPTSVLYTHMEKVGE